MSSRPGLDMRRNRRPGDITLAARRLTDFPPLAISETTPMKTIDVSKIDFMKLGRELRRYERQWIAITERNEVVGHGDTYAEAVEGVKNPDEVILFKVPPLDYSLAPSMHEVSLLQIRHGASE